MYSINDIIKMLEITTFPDELTQRMHSSYFASGSYFINDTLDMLTEKIANVYIKNHTPQPVEPNLVPGIIQYIHKKIINLKTRIPAKHQNDENMVLKYIAQFIVQDSERIGNKNGLESTLFLDIFQHALIAPDAYTEPKTILIKKEQLSDFQEYVIRYGLLQQNKKDNTLFITSKNIRMGKTEEFELLQLLTELLKDKKLKEEHPTNGPETNEFDDLLLSDILDTHVIPPLETRITDLITKTATSNAYTYVLDRANVREYIKIHHLESLMHDLTPLTLRNTLNTASLLGLNQEKTKEYIRNTQNMSISLNDLPEIEF